MDQLWIFLVMSTLFAAAFDWFGKEVIF